MKTPAWINDKIAELGYQVVEGKITKNAAAEELAGKIRADNGALLLEILTTWCLNKIKGWITAKGQDSAQANEVAGQARLPFEELSPWLEVAPGVQKHQNVMTGRDWDNALAIWKNRMEQAELSFAIFKRCYECIRPLLVDDVLTTADVAGDLDPEPGDEAATT